MDAENWNKFCKVFNLDVAVTVKKQVTRSDIVQTLIREGEFIFKGENDSFTMISLSNRKNSLTKKEIETIKSITWDSIEKYLLKTKEVKKSGN